MTPETSLPVTMTLSAVPMPQEMSLPVLPGLREEGIQSHFLVVIQELLQQIIQGQNPSKLPTAETPSLDRSPLLVQTLELAKETLEVNHSVKKILSMSQTTVVKYRTVPEKRPVITTGRKWLLRPRIDSG